MKKRIIAILLMTAISVLSLSSCLFIDLDKLTDGFFGDGTGGSSGGTAPTINVQGGDSYNVTINSSAQQSLLAANKALLSSVSIYTSNSAGSGVIYKLDKERGDAYIITNYHVIYNESTRRVHTDIDAFLYGQEVVDYAIPAMFLGGSKSYDIAVLKVTASTVLMESIAEEVTLADSDFVAILDTAIAIGNAEGGGISATVGCINVDSENIDVSTDGGSAVSLRVMRTDAAVNSGNSGGGLFNEKGELIGIVNAKSAGDKTDNIGYAIPSNVARAVADNILHHCNGLDKTSVYKYMLGITVSPAKMYTKYDTDSGKILKMEEVTVMELTLTSSVKGLIKENDIINSITVDGVKHEVTRTFHVVDSMLDVRADSVLSMNVTRNGEVIDVSIPIKPEMLTANN